MEVSIEEIRELQLKLRSIPHLELNMHYDAELMTEEYLNLQNKFGVRGYNADYAMLTNYYKDRWMGISLNSEDGELYTELKVRDRNNDAQSFRMTEAGKESPYLMEILSSLGSENKRARVLVLAPKSTVGWHSHYINYQKEEHLQVTQVPFVVPENFKYVVMNGFDYAFSDFTKVPKTYSQEYMPGSAYIFNSYHYHNVFNNSDDYRVTLEFHTDLSIRKTFNIVKNAVEAYDGPLI
jgi:hypothetical protein